MINILFIVILALFGGLMMKDYLDFKRKMREASDYYEQALRRINNG